MGLSPHALLFMWDGGDARSNMLSKHIAIAHNQQEDAAFAGLSGGIRRGCPRMGSGAHVRRLKSAVTAPTSKTQSGRY